MHTESLRGISPGGSVHAGGGAEGATDILLVDDDRAMLETLACYFHSRGFAVTTATSLAEARACFRQRPHWRLVLSDFHLPDGTGAEFDAWLHAQGSVAPPFLLMSGSLESHEVCGYDYLAKPFSLRALEERLGDLLAPRPV